MSTDPTTTTMTAAGDTLPENKIVMTIPETANALALSRSMVYQLIGLGELVRVKQGTRAMVTIASARAYIERLVAAQHPQRDEAA